jgi:hypothetical protein
MNNVIRFASPLVLFLNLFLPDLVFATLAQPVPIPEDQSTAPQLEVSGVGIATMGLGNTSEHGTSNSFNFSDSSLLFGAAQRLFNTGIGSFQFGALSSDAANRGTGSESPLFIYQAVLDYQTETFEVAIGRTDNQNSHFIDFPLLRGDDLVTLTNPVNPFSNGVNPGEHRYANVGTVTYNQNLAYFENIHAQQLIDSAGIGDDGISSFGASFQYMAPPGLENFSTVPLWGIGYERILISQNSANGLNQIYAGAVINVRKSVTGLIDVRFQDTASLGSTLSSFQSASDSFQADSNALAASFRYLNRPFGNVGYQISLTAAYKNYFKVSDADSFGAALTAVKQLGTGFSVVAQYQGQFRGKALAAVQSKSIAFENIFELGMIFNFDAVFNQHISPRRTLLNQQYSYIPN